MEFVVFRCGPGKLEATAFAQQVETHWLGALWHCGPGSVCWSLREESFRCALACWLFVDSGLGEREGGKKGNNRLPCQYVGPSLKLQDLSVRVRVVSSAA